MIYSDEFDVVNPIGVYATVHTRVWALPCKICSTEIRHCDILKNFAGALLVEKCEHCSTESFLNFHLYAAG